MFLLGPSFEFAIFFKFFFLYILGGPTGNVPRVLREIPRLKSWINPRGKKYQTKLLGISEHAPEEYPEEIPRRNPYKNSAKSSECIRRGLSSRKSYMEFLKESPEDVSGGISRMSFWKNSPKEFLKKFLEGAPGGIPRSCFRKAKRQ